MPERRPGRNDLVGAAALHPSMSDPARGNRRPPPRLLLPLAPTKTRCSAPIPSLPSFMIARCRRQILRLRPLPVDADPSIEFLVSSPSRSPSPLFIFAPPVVVSHRAPHRP